MHDGDGGQERLDERVELGRGSVGAVWRRVYVAGGVCSGHDPTNGQEALDNSVSVPDNPGVFVGVDYDAGAIVVFHQLLAGEFPKCAGYEIFHGRVEPWPRLSQPCRHALVAARMVSPDGEIL